MAKYHLTVRMLSRSDGRSAIAAAAYRSASLLKDERQGLAFDYTKKKGIAYSEILAPENSPDWIKNREKLWNAVEAAESRINSQVAREVELAIPVELSKLQGIELVKAFVNKEFVSLGMIADVNVHLDNPENPHAHILLTTREITPEGFAAKNRSWNDKVKLQEWRRGWAEIANEHLREAGYEVEIDHRSYQEQGIELTPSKHLGTLLHEVLQKARKKGDTETIESYDRLSHYQQIARSNGALVVANPDVALDALTAQQAVFSDIDIAKFANRNSIDPEQFENVVLSIKNHSHTIKIGKTGQGRFLYTSKEMLELEAGMIQRAIDLSKVKEHGVADKYQEQALHGTFVQKVQQKVQDLLSSKPKPKLILNNSQLHSLSYILEEGDLKIVIGFAGTGKSTLMSVAKDAWEGQGYRVLGMALSGIAAQNLQETGIQSRTIDSLLLSIAHNTVTLTSNDVLVIDEAGMINSRRLSELLFYAQSARAKVVMVGDPEQLQPIQAGAPLRAIAERVGYSELNEIIRQNDPLNLERTAEMRRASQEFATKQTWQGLERYYQMGCIHEHKTKAEAIDAIIEAWSKEYSIQVRDNQQSQQNRQKQHKQQKQQSKSIMLAYTRRDVAILNEKAREFLKSKNLLQDEYIIKVKNREGETLDKTFAVNDRVYFIRNDRSLGVKNGSLGKILDINASQNVLAVLLDTGSVVVFSLTDYNSLDHGYAATIHKSQGITIENTYVLPDKHLDRHLTYVLATRHIKHLEIHYDKETFTDKYDLYRGLSREKTKDMAIDYTDIRDIHSMREAVEAEAADKLEKAEKARIEQNMAKYSPELIAQLGLYFDKHEKYSELVKLKVITQDRKSAKSYAEEATKLGKEVAVLEQSILSKPEVKKALQQNKQSKEHGRSKSLRELGGFKEIEERFKARELTPEHFIALVRHIRNHHDQSKEHSRSRYLGHEQEQEY